MRQPDLSSRLTISGASARFTRVAMCKLNQSRPGQSIFVH